MALSLSNLDIKVMGDAIVLASQRQILPFGAFAQKVDVKPDVMLGDTVQVPYLYKAAAASAYNASSNNYKTDNGGTAGTKAVTLNKHYKSGFTITGAQYNRMGDAWVQATLQSHIEAVYESLFLDGTGLITNANFGAAAVTGIASTFDATDMNRLRKALRANVGPTIPLVAALTPDYYENLLEDASLKNAYAYGGTEVARDGVLRGVRGISETFESNLIPSNSENLVGFATDRTGILMGLCIPQKPAGMENLVDYQLLNDPMTGLTIGVYKQWDDATHSAILGAEVMGGFAVGRAAGLVRIMSA
jgi:hypothetical protein